MKILVLSATPFEIMPFRAYLQERWTIAGETSFIKGTTEIDLLITGVGMVATTYALTRCLSANSYDFILQAGVGGSFDRTLSLGSVIHVTEDVFADLGAEDHYRFMDVFDMELMALNSFPFTGKKLINPLQGLAASIVLPKVSGLTVNTVTGSDFTTALRLEQYGCQAESMEGAALHYVCLHENIPFAQVRSLSNYVEARDKSKWRMKEAILQLNEWLVQFTEGLH